MSTVTTTELEVGDTIITPDGIILEIKHKYNLEAIEVVGLYDVKTGRYYNSLSDYGLRAIGARPYHLAEQDRVEHD